jgi:hypothetical protein
MVLIEADETGSDKMPQIGHLPGELGNTSKSYRSRSSRVGFKNK